MADADTCAGLEASADLVNPDTSTNVYADILGILVSRRAPAFQAFFEFYGWSGNV